MRFVFVSNYYTHHQSALSERLYDKLGDNYKFIQTEHMDEERLKMGWIETIPPFVIESYKSDESYSEAVRLIQSADVVVIGSAPKYMERMRLQTGKLTIKYSERIYKPSYQRYKNFLRVFKYYFEFHKFNNLFLLCASAYAYADYAKSGLFKNKAFKWGYFPTVKKYDDIEELIDDKTSGSILWAARFIDWKHPEVPIRVAKRLKQSGYKFKLSLIGNGELENKIRDMIKAENLEDCVQMLGSMKPEEVRRYMEQSEIFLFTSDFNEGWGAVLNESMNSACAVVASHAIGSVPFLINDGENGFIYKNGDERDLFKKVKYLLDNPKKCSDMGKNAYASLMTTWNADVAGDRLLTICSGLLKGENVNDIYIGGPCSMAKIIKNNWYKSNND